MESQADLSGKADSQCPLPMVIDVETLDDLVR